MGEAKATIKWGFLTIFMLSAQLWLVWFARSWSFAKCWVQDGVSWVMALMLTLDDQRDGLRTNKNQLPWFSTVPFSKIILDL